MKNEEQTNAREMTFGEKAVGLTFNPSNDETVDKVKRLYAEIIDLIVEEKSKPCTEAKTSAFDVAIMHAQTAQMWAVKGVTYKF